MCMEPQPPKTVVLFSTISYEVELCTGPLTPDSGDLPRASVYVVNLMHVYIRLPVNYLVCPLRAHIY